MVSESKAVREILFRGKENPIGKWVEGFYNHIPCGRFLCDEHLIQTIDTDGRIGQLFTVYDSTVGQFTGLTDKNGKKIFEGDIVHCISTFGEANCVVIFEDGEFRLVPEKYYKTYITGCGFHALRCFTKEVIGNIYDNPELLEVEDG